MPGSTSDTDLDLDPNTLFSNGSDNASLHVPLKYSTWSSVFTSSDVNSLPPHRPYNINIELEEGKSPLFGPMYHLTLEEYTALMEYVELN